jgi:hypothetical protein
MWSDRSFFQNTVNLVFGTLADKVPQDFIEDRERLRGAKFDVKAMKAAIPQMRDQLRAHVGWIEAQLGDSREWLLGNFSLADINAYMNVWYTRANLSNANHMLAKFPRTLAWENVFRPLDMVHARKCRPARLWTSQHRRARNRRHLAILTIRMAGSRAIVCRSCPMTMEKSRCAARSSHSRHNHRHPASRPSGR